MYGSHRGRISGGYDDFRGAWVSVWISGCRSMASFTIPSDAFGCLGNSSGSNPWPGFSTFMVPVVVVCFADFRISGIPVFQYRFRPAGRSIINNTHLVRLVVLLTVLELTRGSISSMYGLYCGWGFGGFSELRNSRVAVLISTCGSGGSFATPI